MKRNLILSKWSTGLALISLVTLYASCKKEEQFTFKLGIVNFCEDDTAKVYYTDPESSQHSEVLLSKYQPFTLRTVIGDETIEHSPHLYLILDSIVVGNKTVDMRFYNESLNWTLSTFGNPAVVYRNFMIKPEFLKT